MGYTLKIWSKTLKLLYEFPFTDSIGYIKYFDKFNLIGLSGNSKELFVSLWDFPNSTLPQYTIKGNNKQPVIKFDVDRQFRFLVTLSRDNIVSVHGLEEFKETERSIKVSMTVDQNDCISINLKKNEDYLIYTRFTNLRSLFVDQIDFSKISDELLYYEKSYCTVSEDISKQMAHNVNEMSKINNTYIKNKWILIKKLYDKYKQLKNGEKQGQDDSLLDANNINCYYQENFSELSKDIVKEHLSLKTSILKVNEQVVRKIKTFVMERGKEVINLNHENLITTCISTIEQLIDDCEMIHAYHMYKLLKTEFRIPEEFGVRLEHAYISMLRDQQLHVTASKMIKNSVYKSIQELNSIKTKFNFRCSNCNRLLNSNEEGQCKRCGGVVCVICDKEIKGLIITCEICNHSGHFREMYDWFRKDKKDVFCPEGCAHRCHIFN